MRCAGSGVANDYPPSASTTSTARAGSQLPGGGRHRRSGRSYVSACGRHAVPGTSPPVEKTASKRIGGHFRCDTRLRHGVCGTPCVEGGLLTDGFRAGPLGPCPATATVLKQLSMLVCGTHGAATHPRSSMRAMKRLLLLLWCVGAVVVGRALPSSLTTGSEVHQTLAQPLSDAMRCVQCGRFRRRAHD